MNSFFLKQKTPVEINALISSRLREIRKKRGLSQVKLSEKSGVSLGSVKRFESSGEISLLSMTKIAIALECDEELQELFTHSQPTSIEEVLRENSNDGLYK